MQKNIFIIVGATADIVTKKVLPSLLSLYKENKLSEATEFIAFSRRDYSDQDYLNFIFENSSIQRNKESIQFFEKFKYFRGDFFDRESFSDFATLLDTKYHEFGRIFYFAVAPLDLVNILSNLNTYKSIQSNSKLIIEKPIGDRLANAIEIESFLSENFSEQQLYRIDHYLAKPLLLNINKFFTYNDNLRDIWNSKYIKSIRVVLKEELGVESRGSFYDSTGALRDVGQNHSLEILAYMLMNTRNTITDITKSRIDALQKIKIPSITKIQQNTVRKQHRGYTDIENVANDSKTETFFRIQLESNDEKWQGTELILEGGKKFESTEKYIKINFKDGNTIRFRIDPKPMIEDTFKDNFIKNKEIINDLDQLQIQYVGEYAHLISDVTKGSQENFITHEEVITLWSIVDPIIDAWSKGIVPLEYY